MQTILLFLPYIRYGKNEWTMPVPARIAIAWALLEAEMILEEARRKAQASPDNKKVKKASAKATRNRS